MNAEGAALVGLRRFEQAEPLLVRQHRCPEDGADSRDSTLSGKRRLVELYDGWGKPEQARKARQALASAK